MYIFYFEIHLKYRQDIDGQKMVGKRSCSLSYSCLGKIEKSFSPKLMDYFIQGVRNIYYNSFCIVLLCFDLLKCILATQFAQIPNWFQNKLKRLNIWFKFNVMFSHVIIKEKKNLFNKSCFFKSCKIIQLYVGMAIMSFSYA